ncbi:hypothetical protein ACFYX8_23775 [Streptomyces cyaneofuscatus]|uniref:hypothetical protein n=1 Tax=Streptomyces cyaneofuscatus TaxID=66883 RepID=UPI0036B24CC8
MTGHEDVPYQEQQVAPPDDLRRHTDGTGVPEFTGTCPVCHGQNVFALPRLSPGTVPKRWRRRRNDGSPTPATEQHRMDCECPVTHPMDPLEQGGCGAWWTVAVQAAAPQGS